MLDGTDFRLLAQSLFYVVPRCHYRVHSMRQHCVTATATRNEKLYSVLEELCLGPLKWDESYLYCIMHPCQILTAFLTYNITISRKGTHVNPDVY